MSDTFRESVIKKLKNGDFDCTKEFTISMFSGKHKLMILWIIMNDGPQNFSYFMHNINGISKKVLSNQLKELIGDKILGKEEYMLGNVQYSKYYLTEVGQSLKPILNSLNTWGKSRLNSVDIKKQFNNK